MPGDPSLPFEHPEMELAAATWKGGEWWKFGGGGKKLFPSIHDVGGEEMSAGEPAAERPVKKTYDSPRAYCLLAKQELGLTTHAADETIRATGDSLSRLGLLNP